MVFATVNEKKRLELLALVDHYKPDIIHLTETHLDKSIKTSEILDPDFYEVQRKDRNFTEGHEGGGVLNAVHKDLIASGEANLDTNCEIAWTKLQLKGSKPLYTGCFYRPPDNNITPLEQLDLSMNKISNEHSLPNIILTGDFNSPDIVWDEESKTTRSNTQYNAGRYKQ